MDRCRDRRGDRSRCALDLPPDDGPNSLGAVQLVDTARAALGVGLFDAGMGDGSAGVIRASAWRILPLVICCPRKERSVGTAISSSVLAEPFTHLWIFVTLDQLASINRVIAGGGDLASLLLAVSGCIPLLPLERDPDFPAV